MGALTRGDRRAATGGGGGGGGGGPPGMGEDVGSAGGNGAEAADEQPSMLESIGGGGDAGLGEAALVDSAYGLNALRAMCDAARLSRRASERAMARAASGTEKEANEAIEALLPPTVTLAAVAAGVATALEHLPPSLRETDRCIGLLLEAADPTGGASGEVRLSAARSLLEVTAEALELMDLGEIGSDASLPGFAARPMAGVSKSKQRAASATGVKKFLNRLLAKRIEVQVVVFSFFMASLESKIAMAKRAGTFDAGVSKLVGTLVPESESSIGAVIVAGRAATTTTAAASANAAAAASPDELFRLLWRERQPPHRELRFVELRVDRGVSFEDAAARLSAQLPKPHPRARTGFFVSKGKMFGQHHGVLLALVRGYSAPRGAAAKAAAAADAAFAAAEKGEEEEAEEVGNVASAVDAHVPASAAAAGLQTVGAGNKNFYSVAQQHQHRQWTVTRNNANNNGGTISMPSFRPPPVTYQVIRPNTGTGAGDMAVEELLRIYEQVEPKVRIFFSFSFLTSPSSDVSRFRPFFHSPPLLSFSLLLFRTQGGGDLLETGVRADRARVRARSRRVQGGSQLHHRDQVSFCLFFCSRARERIEEEENEGRKSGPQRRLTFLRNT